jgi:hypothetical protein
VGHLAPSVEGELWAAVLYAGPGGMLSHMTAAWWRGLIEYAPPAVDVRSPRRCRSRPGIRIHGRSRCRRELHKGIPVTSVEQTALDLAAATGPDLTLTRKALGRLDYRHRLDLDALLRVCGRGLAGSAWLNQAIASYDPRFGLTNSPLEDRWLLFCERQDVPKPDEVDVWLHGVEIDAWYAEARLAVQLDGADAHHSVAQMRRDHSNDLTLRQRGIRVSRYTWALIDERPRAVRADVLQALASPQP